MVVQHVGGVTMCRQDPQERSSAVETLALQKHLLSTWLDIVGADPSSSVQAPNLEIPQARRAFASYMRRLLRGFLQSWFAAAVCVSRESLLHFSTFAMLRPSREDLHWWCGAPSAPSTALAEICSVSGELVRTYVTLVAQSPAPLVLPDAPLLARA